MFEIEENATLRRIARETLEREQESPLEEYLRLVQRLNSEIMYNTEYSRICARCAELRKLFTEDDILAGLRDTLAKAKAAQGIAEEKS